MRIILSKLTYSGQAMKHPGLFVSVHQTHLEISYGQIPVRTNCGFIDEHMGQTVHRLDPIGLAFHLCEVHIFPVVFEVSRLLPHFGLEQLGPADHLIPAAEMCFLLEGLYDMAEQSSFGMIDDQSRSRLITYMEEIQFFP